MPRPLFGLTSLALLALIGGASTIRTDWRGAWGDSQDDGATQAALEDAFDSALVIREPAIHAWNALRYFGFGETLPGAVAGRDHWLFTDEEYVAPADFQARRTASVTLIAQAVARLEAAGSDVRVVLLPDKARVYPDKLQRPRPPLVEGRYAATMADLAQAGVEVVGALTALTDGRAVAAMFLARDTHWTPQGAQAVARAVAPHILSLTETRATFSTALGSPVAHEGDLVTFADAGMWSDALGLGPETIDRYTTTQAASEDLSAGLFGDIDIPAVLIGTSYSAVPTWHFEGFLKQESQTDILNLSTQGEGPFAPMQAYLAEVDAGRAPASVVIWEVPERYLTLDKETVDP